MARGSCSCKIGRPPSSVRATVEGAPMGWPSLEGKARHIPTPSKRDLGVPMAAPLSGTEVPCSPHSEESPEGDRPSPAGATELAAAEATAGVAVATIAPLAPLERGGRSGVENSQTRYLTCNAYCSAVKNPCRRRSPSSRSPWASPAGAGPSELNAALISKARHSDFFLSIIVFDEVKNPHREGLFPKVDNSRRGLHCMGAERRRHSGVGCLVHGPTLSPEQDPCQFFSN